MKNKVFFTIVILLACFSVGVQANILLHPGMEKSVKRGTNITQISIGNPNIANVNMTGTNEILLTGVGVGRTTLIVWDNGQRMPTEIVTVIPDVDPLKRKLGESGFSRINVSEKDGMVVVSGVLDSIDQYENVTNIIRSYLGDNFINRIQVTGTQMVSIHVTFASVSSSLIRSFGLNFRKLSQGFAMAMTPPGTLQNYAMPFQSPTLNLDSNVPIGDAFNVLAASPNKDILGILSILERHSLAAILTEPELITRSGTAAEFRVGGQVPIPVPQGTLGGALSIEYVPYGVSLQVTPVISGRDYVSMRVAPEVSELDYGNALLNQGLRVPAIRTRNAVTTVEMKFGSSFVLAGMTSVSQNSTKDSVPFFGDIPVLGTLFKSTTQSRETQELIIVVKPVLVRPIENPELIELPGAEWIRHGVDRWGDIMINKKTETDKLFDSYGLIQ